MVKYPIWHHSRSVALVHDLTHGSWYRSPFRYSAGGCTTTRESLEVGAVVVTLPAPYLGGRWSLAYFQQMGVLDTVAKKKKGNIFFGWYFS